jgi:hypothetical protein
MANCGHLKDALAIDRKDLGAAWDPADEATLGNVQQRCKHMLDKAKNQKPAEKLLDGVDAFWTTIEAADSDAAGCLQRLMYAAHAHLPCPRSRVPVKD